MIYVKFWLFIKVYHIIYGNNPDVILKVQRCVIAFRVMASDIDGTKKSYFDYAVPNYGKVELEHI